MTYAANPIRPRTSGGIVAPAVNDRRIPDPVLLASDVRVDVDGVPGCEGLSFRTKGEHVLVLGAPSALFRATVGLLPVTRGTLTIRGAPSDEAVGFGLIAGAPLDPPLPPRWTVHEYVAWSARLSGAPESEAKGAAGRMGLDLDRWYGFAVGITIFYRL